MYKGSDIIGKPIITYNTGIVIERIKDILFDAPKRKVLGFLVGESGIFKKAKMVPFSEVKALGIDAVTVEDKDAIVESSEDKRVGELAESHNIAKGTRIMTEQGQDLGSISDLYFNESTGEIEGYEVSGGVFSDAYSGKSFLPAPQTLKIGKDVAFVPTETARLMEEQVGGIKGAVQQATDSAYNMADRAKDQAQDAWQGASQMAKEQGKKIKGGLTEAAGAAQSVQQAIGRRVHQTVRDSSGSIIAAVGQIIDQTAADAARRLNKEAELLEATGVQTSKSAKTKARGAVKRAESSAQEIWGNVKDKAKQLKEQASGKIEERRIQAALGRPVTRVILDKNDNVILNTGELVTHQAVERAREAGALEALLGSVTEQRPKFGSEELKSKTVDDQT